MGTAWTAASFARVPKAAIRRGVRLVVREDTVYLLSVFVLALFPPRLGSTIGRGRYGDD